MGKGGAVYIKIWLPKGRGFLAGQGAGARGHGERQQSRVVVAASFPHHMRASTPTPLVWPEIPVT